MSAFLNPRGHPARLVSRWRTGGIRVVTSLSFLGELTKVLARPRLQRVRRFAAVEADLYLVMIQAGADIVTPTGRLHMCRDATDDLLLETALLGRAKFLVSRDADVIRDIALIRAFRERGVRIVTVGQFLRLVLSNK